MKKCAHCGRENNDSTVICAGCGTEQHSEPGPPNISTNTLNPKRPEVACPNCGNSENLESVVFPHKKFSWLFFFLGGILSVLFLNVSRPRRFRCHNCAASFYIRSPGAKFMLVLLVVWLLFIWLPLVVSLLFP